MPIGKLLIQHLILTDLEHLSQTSPASPNGLGVVVGAALVDEALRDLFLLVFGLLHLDDELVVGVEFGGDFLGEGGAATGEFGAFVVGAGKAVGNGWEGGFLALLLRLRGVSDGTIWNDLMDKVSRGATKGTWGML